MLGYSIRAKMTCDTQPSMVNLLQQTPADKVLGDVLIEFTGATRLIEFKQKSNNSKKERLKQSIIKRLILGDSRLEKLSRSVHWFIETHPSDDYLQSTAIPYLDAFSGAQSSLNLWEFIDRTSYEAVKREPQFSSDELKRYLRLIANASGSDHVGTGGLLLHLDKSGSIKYIEIADMTQMRLSHKEFLKDMEKRYQNELTQTLSSGHELVRKRDRGLSI